jgi:hypothetical protein
MKALSLHSSLEAMDITDAFVCTYIRIMYASQFGIHLFNILLFIEKHVSLIPLLSF